MKACKRWITKTGATCAICRQGYPAGARGILADLAGPIELTTIVKFICLDCATPIATAMGDTLHPSAAPSRGTR